MASSSTRYLVCGGCCGLALCRFGPGPHEHARCEECGALDHADLRCAHCRRHLRGTGGATFDLYLDRIDREQGASSRGTVLARSN